MSKRIGNIIILESDEPEAPCELCGKIADLRPYGPGFKRICYECGMKNPELTQRQTNQKLFGDKPQ